MRLYCKCDTCAAWAWHCIYVKPGWAQLVWMSYLSQYFVRKLTSCEFVAESSIWPQLSGDDSLAERELTGAAALLCRQMLRAFPRLSGDHHCFLWAPLCLVLWSVPLITACLPVFFPHKLPKHSLGVNLLPFHSFSGSVQHSHCAFLLENISWQHVS